MKPFDEVILAILRSNVDLTTRQLGILLLCEEADCSIAVLSKSLNSAGPTIGAAVAALEKHLVPFVERYKVEGDRRVVMVRLTDPGRRFLRQFYKPER